MNKYIFLHFLICAVSCTNPNQRADVASNTTLVTEETTQAKMGQPCDIDQLVKTEKNLKNLSLDQVRSFLETINQECKNNVEFSEYSNELLYKVLQSYPELFLEALSKASNLDYDYILLQLELPLLDFDLDQIIRAVQNVKIESKEKQQLIESLEKAKKTH